MTAPVSLIDKLNDCLPTGGGGMYQQNYMQGCIDTLAKVKKVIMEDASNRKDEGSVSPDLLTSSTTNAIHAKVMRDYQIKPYERNTDTLIQEALEYAAKLEGGCARHKHMGAGSCGACLIQSAIEANRGEMRLTSEHSERERGDHWKGKAFDALEVLRDLVADIEDYERVNNLHPNPGRKDCWHNVTRAKAVLSGESLPVREAQPEQISDNTSVKQKIERAIWQSFHTQKFDVVGQFSVTDLVTDIIAILPRQLVREISRRLIDEFLEQPMVAEQWEEFKRENGQFGAGA